jgi:hypothetical protein
MLALLVLLFTGWTAATTPRYGPHSALDLLSMRSSEDGLFVMHSPYFATAGRCSGCHGRDTMGLAMVTSEGVDVNVADDWRSTLMANSARDPFFLAKADHEVLVNPGHQTPIENKCLSCHAPLGMHEERMLGHAPFNLAMLDTSVMGKEGVSCLACHMQDPDSAGNFFSGELHFDSARVYGPYPDDEINVAIMEFFVGFRPGLGTHILDGRVCAGCHSLITETLDLTGTPTGGEFVEQATWHEWKNSIYPANEETSCRGCHIPRIDDPIILASEYAFLPGHTPFGKHHLVGANAHMLRLMKDNREALGIPATDVHFDSTIARTLRTLQGAVEVAMEVTDRTNDTAFVAVQLTNLAGHKFPSGYPSRRAFVQLIATNTLGDTLFQSGRWDGTYELLGHDAGYEPHHDVITQGEQVQIYELVMGDVNGDVTTVLERAAAPLKDNRLVPDGFSTTHPSYDTTQIAGVPAADINFNHDAMGTEGSGTDVVHYHIATNGYTGPLVLSARVYYQPMPPLWNAEMFGHHSAAIDTFRTMLDSSDGTPELVAMDTLTDNSVSIAENMAGALRAFPNPTVDGRVNIDGSGITGIRVFDAAGRELDLPNGRRPAGWWCQLPRVAGTYNVLVRSANGERLMRVVNSAH